MFSWIRQVVAVSLFNLRSIPARLGSSASTVLGVAGVVLVFIGVLSIGVGFKSTFGNTGDPETVIVMRSSASSEMSSALGADEAKLIGQAPGIAVGESGVLSSSELFVIVDVPKRSTGTEANVPLRGVSPQAFEVRGDFEIIEGRNFEPGKNEVIVGQGAASQFAGLDVGNSLKWGQNMWTVVGLFESGGSAEESEIWTDAKVLQPAYRRGNSYQSVHLRLTDAAGFDELARVLKDDPQLSVMVERKSEWFASQGSGLSITIFIFGGAIAFLMGFGAIFGALNTMYTAVSARTREIATLRALGFGTSPVVASVLLEAIVLSALGGVLGAGIAYAAFNGFQASTLNWQSFSQITFAFAVTPPLMIAGLVYALVMGFVGGLFPAWRAARLPVSTALRESA